MSDSRDFRHDLEPGLPDDLLRLGDRLQEPPLPALSFRGSLRRRLLAQRIPAPRPENLRALVTAFAAAGATLLAIAALSVAGIGPLGA